MHKEIYFAGGCFWGVEKYFALIDGVIRTKAGYANGKTENPTYEEVCRNGTGHAETVKVVYDSEKISLDFLLEMFFEVIDPTAVNRQGPDIGVQYRSGIYYQELVDLPVILAALEKLQKQYREKIAVEVEALKHFYEAEEYHQDYLAKNPGGYCHISPSAFDKAAHAKPVKYQRKSREELQKILSDIQFQVTQNSATEPPFRNEYHDEFRKGIYVDITTGEPLFVSSHKFESGCGWPSFAKPISDSLIAEVRDDSHGMQRIEVRSKTGDAHLGHVFEDGPRELGGLRYCINSASLKFIPYEEMEQAGYREYMNLF